MAEQGKLRINEYSFQNYYVWPVQVPKQKYLTIFKCIFQRTDKLSHYKMDSSPFVINKVFFPGEKMLF